MNSSIAPERFSPVRLGKAPAKGSPKLLHLSNFTDLTKVAPLKTTFWKNRAAFPKRSFGNLELGDCTRAKQAYAAMRMQRIEGGRAKTINITDEEVKRVYLEGTGRRYGGGDTGYYETDALDDWRNQATTFKDDKGHILTIDAYTAINHRNINEVKNAIALSGSHGIAICLNLPFNFQEIPGGPWIVPSGQAPVGPFLPGSWGGHSMWALEYDPNWVLVDSTWEYGVQKISWEALAIYMDEAYFVFDSLDYWRKVAAKKVDLDGIKKEVNRVSSIKIK